MKILHVTAQKPDCTGSGVYLAQVVAAFARAGHEQAVICGIGPGEEYALGEDVRLYPVGFETERIPFPVCGMSDVMPYKATRYRDLTPEMAAQFEDAFTRMVDVAYEEFKPDLVICNHLYFLTSIVRERVTEVPVVAICHATCLRQLKTNPFQVDRITNAIAQLDHIFALHSMQRETILDMFDIDAHLVDVIGTGYDDATFAVNAAVERCSHPKRIVYAGKISYAKGVASLMRALPLMSIEPGELEVRCVGGAGDQEEFEDIQALAKLSPYPVHFLGRVSTEELIEEYQKADTFVLPSFHEGLPLVTIEALACGCKAVCCDWPGVRPWMEERLGKAPMRYVALPENVDIEKPTGPALQDFAARLAAQLEASLADEAVACDMSGLTWDALVARLMGFLGLAL